METIVVEPTVKETPKQRPHYQFQPGNKMSTGRPVGTGNKLSIKSLLNQLSDTVGKPYEQQLAENYRDAIVNNDTKLIHAYDHLFLSKLLADKVSVEVAETQEIVDAKRAAFMSALQSYGQAVIEDHRVEHNTVTVDADVVDSRATMDHNDPTVEDNSDHRE